MRERVYAFDFLRAFMMFLGIFLHGLLFAPTISFLGETWSARVITFSAEIIHTFRMPLFFCLSGYVSAQLFCKLGVRGFCVNRFKRLIVPFVLSLLPICFISNVFHHGLTLYSTEKELFTLLTTTFSLRYFRFEEIEPIHLWFLYYLTLFIPVMLLVNHVAGKVNTKRVESLLIRIGNRPNTQPAFLILLAVIPTFLLLATGNNGNPTPRSFVISLENFLPYFYYFSFGWCLHKLQFNLGYFTHKAGWMLVLAVLLTFARLVAWSFLGEQHLLVLVILYNLSLWCYIFGFIGIVQLYFQKPSASLQYFSDASYWIYLIHYPIIVGLKIFFFEPTSLSTFTMLLLLTTALSVVSYNYLVRPTVIGKLLNGKILPSYPVHKPRLNMKPARGLKPLSHSSSQEYVARSYRLLKSKEVQRL